MLLLSQSSIKYNVKQKISEVEMVNRKIRWMRKHPALALILVVITLIGMFAILTYALVGDNSSKQKSTAEKLLKAGFNTAGYQKVEPNKVSYHVFSNNNTMTCIWSPTCDKKPKLPGCQIICTDKKPPPAKRTK